jgi:hypothetical protein
MAGSLNHITAEDGSFRMDTIENLGDAAEALEECHQIIAYLLAGWGDRQRLAGVCEAVGAPVPKAVPKLRR